VAKFKVVIADVAELTEEVQKVVFASRIPYDARVRNSELECTLSISGFVSFDKDKVFMKDALKEISEWSVVKPDVPADVYKKVTVEYFHDGSPRKYELSHAFVVSFTEEFGADDGRFELIVKQKMDRMTKGDEVTIA
jgi:hypothetical protein